VPTTAAEESFTDVLHEGAARLGIKLSGDGARRLLRHFRLLLRWMDHTNLTTVRDPVAMAERLYLDSLLPAAWLGQGARVHDVGPGAGFPGLVLKAHRPDLIVTLSEARRKKVSFLRQAAREMDLTEGLVIEQHRVVGGSGGVAGRWTEVISRATFPPPVWIRLGTELTEPGGRLWLFGGQSHQAGGDDPEELSPRVCQELPTTLRVERIHPYRLEHAGLQRTLVSFRKRL